jgi:uncharacterized protein (TIGR03435 family)
MISTLATHLWQSTLFAIFAGLLTVPLRNNRAHLRYSLWLSASVKFLIPFSLLIQFGGHLEWAATASKMTPVAISRAVVTTSQPFSSSFSVSKPQSPGLDWPSIAAVTFWIAGFAVIVSLRTRDWLRIRQAVRSGTVLDLAVNSLTANVEVRSSPGLLEPGVVGWLRPTILLPSGILERLSPGQLEAVLAHELCHVRRRDNLTAALHMLVEAIFWFHPLVWWIGARLLEEREQACDEAVVQFGRPSHVYAEAILTVCRYYLESPLPCVSGVTGADLKRRIQLILAQRHTPALTASRKMMLVAASLVAILAPVSAGLLNSPQSAAQSFDVASIKPLADPMNYRVVGVDISGTRVTFSAMTLANLVEYSFHVKQYSVLAGPKWASTERWNIAARAEGDKALSDEQVRHMLERLLYDRFHLKLRREMRDTSVYALVEAKGGPKLKESSPDAVAGLYLTGKQTIQITTKKGGMEQLVDELSANLDRPVLNKTGLTGDYDYSLEWAPERDGRPAPEEINAPSIFTALREQLGLKLEPQKAAIEVLVIDSAEKPSEN